MSRNKKRARAGAPAKSPAEPTSAANSSSPHATTLAPPASRLPTPPSTSPQPDAALSLAQMQSVVRQLASVQAWDDMLAYSQTPLDRVMPEDRNAAALYLARMRVAALGLRVPDGRVNERTAPGIGHALADLRQLTDKLWLYPEFAFYLDATEYSLAESIDAFWLLMSACQEKVNAHWLRHLRDRVLRLVDPGDLEEVSEEVRQKLRNLPPVEGLYDILHGALSLALGEAALNEQDQLLVQVLKADTVSRMCEPWHYPQSVQRILALPQATPEQVRGLSTDEYEGRPDNRLTPKAWAFMLELGFIRSDGFKDLVARQPETFGLNAADGLLNLLKSVIAEDAQERDVLLTEAADLLLLAQDYSQYALGENIVLATQQGCTAVWAGHLSLNFNHLRDLVLRMYENVDGKYGRAKELLALYDLLLAMDGTGEEDNFGVEPPIPGLTWLCEQSVTLQMEAASHVKNKALSWNLFIGGLARYAEAQVEVPSNWFFQDSEDEELRTAADAMFVLDALGELVQVRSRMHGKTESLWRAKVKAVFKDLVRVTDNEVTERTLDVARDLEDDLTAADGGSFYLGYLEQVAGDPDCAFDHYLADFQQSEAVGSTVGNLKVLFNRFDDTGRLEQLVEELQELAPPKHPNETAELVSHAKARLKTVREQEQFEKTAVNRWPTLNQPARQVLNALALIQSFSGFEELARYAGMEARWAKHHYGRLVELGLVIESDNGRKFRINQHIKPLLAQENKHAVVGRIVRSSGTSAVKPVFNSQREFIIYQAMTQLCPNHLVFPNCSLQSIISFERIKELVTEDEFSYYMKASVDIVVVNSITYLPMLAIEVDSVWHDTEKQQKNDQKKDRIFAAAGIPFMRLRPVGSPSQATIRGQVAEHLDELVRTLRSDLPGFDQAKQLIEDLSGTQL